MSETIKFANFMVSKMSWAPSSRPLIIRRNGKQVKVLAFQKPSETLEGAILSLVR